MKLYFVRHGESVVNVERVFSYKVVDWGLTPRGREQAERLGAWLADKQIARIYSSPMARALETAQIAAPQLGIDAAAITVLEDLREVNIGVLDGRTGDDLWAKHNAIIRAWWRDNDPDVTFEGGENQSSVKARFARAADRIVTENAALGDDAGVFIAAHSGVITFGLPWYLHRPQIIADSIAMPNTAIAVVDARDGALTLESWNGTPHLPA